jgi:hypothetical protein
MTLFIIMVPLMWAIAIATVPLFCLSVREHRLIHTGSAEKPRPERDTGYSVRKRRLAAHPTGESERHTPIAWPSVPRAAVGPLSWTSRW